MVLPVDSLPIPIRTIHVVNWDARTVHGQPRSARFAAVSFNAPAVAGESTINQYVYIRIAASRAIAGV